MIVSCLQVKDLNWKKIQKACSTITNKLENVVFPKRVFCIASCYNPLLKIFLYIFFVANLKDLLSSL